MVVVVAVVVVACVVVVATVVVAVVDFVVVATVDEVGDEPVVCSVGVLSAVKSSVLGCDSSTLSDVVSCG